MSARTARLLGCAGLAFGVVLLWVHRWPVVLNDFGTEAAAGYRALAHGDLHGFLRLAPAYGGSLELRAPFALLAEAWGGGTQAVYRMAALPCLLAAGALGTWLLARARARGAGAIACGAILAVCLANPITYRALEIGHPEELLGGVLCVAAVLCAARGRAAWAGLLLGLAVGNKQWAVLAVGPVLLALPGKRGLALAWAAGTAGALLAPLLLVSAGDPTGATARLAVTDLGGFFHPQQLWWYAGHHGPWVSAMAGQIPHGYRLAPAWLHGSAHLMIVASALPLTWWSWRRSPGGSDPLLLLALLMLLRCALDPWDVVYYPLPFVLALLAWEVCARRRAPLRSLAATAVTWLLFEILPRHAGVDAQAIAFAALVVPVIAAIAFGLYRPQTRPERVAAARAGPRRSVKSIGGAADRHSEPSFP
jgi:hypothetical protein